MAMAVSSTSSRAPLPPMLDAGREMKRSPPLASFVLPVGASVGRAGSALYQAVAVLFVAQLYSVPFGFTEMFQAGAAVFLPPLTGARLPAASALRPPPAVAPTRLPSSATTRL